MSEVRTIWYEDARHLPDSRIVVSERGEAPMPAALSRGDRVAVRVAFASPGESLGPSNDADIEHEIRASELAILGGTGATYREWLGSVLRHEDWRAPVYDGERAGWLAHAIAHHDEEQAIAIEGDAPEHP